jgi:hypothetical protein
VTILTEAEKDLIGHDRGLDTQKVTVLTEAENGLIGHDRGLDTQKVTVLTEAEDGSIAHPTEAGDTILEKIVPNEAGLIDLYPHPHPLHAHVHIHIFFMKIWIKI